MRSRLQEATVMNWYSSQSSLHSSLCLLLPLPCPTIHPSCLWMLISFRMAVVWGGIHNETENGFLLKQTVTSFLWLTFNRFSLDDSWTWTGGASLPEAQRPRAGCHAQAKRLSLGLLGSSTLDKPDSHALFMLYLPSLINLSQTGQAPRD